MNGIDDLRRTLEVHAHDLPDARAHERATAVRGRVRDVRRRRAAGVVAAAVLGIGAATGVVLLPDSTQPDAAGRTVLGDSAPATLSSLGWTYRFAGARASGDESRVVERLPESDRPRLVTWTTAGDDQDVVVRGTGLDDWVSDADDFADVAWLPANYEGTVTVRADEPGVGMAVYEIDESQVPAGVTRDGVTFREDPAGPSLVAAEVGRRGETDLAFDFTVPETTLSVAHTCSGLPRGAAVHISLDGTDRGVVIGGCETSFDPGGSPNSHFTEGIGVRVGEASTARIWATEGMRSDEPLDPADFPGAQLGLGLYADDTEPQSLVGMEIPEVVESHGRVWTLSSTILADDETGLRYDLTDETGPFVVTAVRHTSGRTTSRLLVDGRDVESSSSLSAGRSATHDHLLPAGTSSVALEVVRGADNVRGLGLAVYRLAD